MSCDEGGREREERGRKGKAVNRVGIEGEKGGKVRGLLFNTIMFISLFYDGVA